MHGACERRGRDSAGDTFPHLRLQDQPARRSNRSSKGFVKTGDREVGALEVSDDPDELNSVTGRGRFGGWERTFVAEETRDDGVVFIQAWLSIYRDPAGAAWAHGENVADTWNESAGAITVIQVPTLGDETVGLAVDQAGEVINAMTIVYLRSGPYSSGVLVAGRKELLAPNIAIVIAERQAARLVPRYKARVRLSGSA